MRKITLPNSFLAEAAEMLRNGQTVRLHIDGASMYPFIRGGKDEVELLPHQGTTPLTPWCCAFYCWEGQYMIHRYIGKYEETCLMMGDGNLARIEQVPISEVIGILSTIYHPDGSKQDCLDSRWLKRGHLWYRLRHIRRFLIPLLKKTIG
ncbi:MAG: hypothetical protein E7099_02015 [Mediterranea massiliensis]|nr:hypothetical protein [Mediterranea massiliensis]